MTDALPTAFGFLLVVLRCAGLFITAPVLGLRPVPARLRLSAAFAVAVAAFMGAGAPAYAAWDQAHVMIIAALSEALVGLSAGLIAMFSIEAAAGAGHLMGVSMGLGMGSLIDPINGHESSAISQLLSFLALGCAVGMGIHREAVAWVCRSIIDMPPGVPADVSDLALRVVTQAAGALALAVRLAFPVLAAVTIGHLSLGLLGRVAPQMGLSNVGFALALLAGMGALYFVAPAAAAVAAQAARSALVVH